MNFTFDQYQEFTDSTAYPFKKAVRDLIENAFSLDVLKPGEGKQLLCDVFELHYLAGKLNGEAGELAEQVFKATRDDGGLISKSRLENIQKELGDTLWYVAQLSRKIGNQLSHIAELNASKLADRAKRDKLHGDGDNR